MGNTTIRLGGVPEHFNLPIHLAQEAGAFEEKGVDLQWTTFKGGTGQMTKALRENEVDACVLLTEGIIKDIIKGNPAKIISVYVKTPLIWGVHTGVKNPLDNYKSIFSKQYAISRFGSGSHLMAIVDANSKGHTIKEPQFEIIKNLEGALEALTAETADVFYWEKFTTKPYVDNGILKRLGEYVTPWPCFVIAAREEILEKEPEAIIRMLRTLHDSVDNFMQDKNACNLVSERYEQKLADVERWYNCTEWEIHGWVSNKMIKSVIYHLKLAGIIDKEEKIPNLIWER
jgi:ABC-type nitrate/sulfonate/bicarbonate transport system substrate-binding protein